MNGMALFSSHAQESIQLQAIQASTCSSLYAPLCFFVPRSQNIRAQIRCITKAYKCWVGCSPSRMNFRFVGSIISSVTLSHIAGVFIVVIDVVVTVSMRVLCYAGAHNYCRCVCGLRQCDRGHCCRPWPLLPLLLWYSMWLTLCRCLSPLSYCACARQRSQTQAPTA